VIERAGTGNRRDTAARARSLGSGTGGKAWSWGPGTAMREDWGAARERDHARRKEKGADRRFAPPRCFRGTNRIDTDLRSLTNKRPLLCATKDTWNDPAGSQFNGPGWKVWKKSVLLAGVPGLTTQTDAGWIAALMGTKARSQWQKNGRVVDRARRGWGGCRQPWRGGFPGPPLPWPMISGSNGHSGCKRNGSARHRQVGACSLRAMTDADTGPTMGAGTGGALLAGKGRCLPHGWRVVQWSGTFTISYVAELSPHAMGRAVAACPGERGEADDGPGTNGAMRGITGGRGRIFGRGQRVVLFSWAVPNGVDLRQACCLAG